MYVTNLTLRKSKSHGILGNSGASIHLDNVSVANSKSQGVWVYDTKRNTMKNCNVSHSKWSGLVVSTGGLMTISGNGTTIHHNSTDGYSGYYGLDTSYRRHSGLYADISSGSIHIVSPLTIEMISKNNDDGRNHGGDGTIKSVDKDGKVLEVVHDGTPDEDEDEDDY